MGSDSNMLASSTLINNNPVNRHYVQQPQRQKGVGLIEILVTVIVLAIGFLAAARMQAEGLRNTQAAYVTSQAGFLIKDMTDRMRSNAAGVADGHYDAIDTDTSDTNRPTCVNTGNSGTSCTPAEIAQVDIADWVSYIQPTGETVTILPSGDTVQARGTITRQTDTFLVSLIWSEIQGGEEVEQRLDMEVVP